VGSILRALAYFPWITCWRQNTGGAKYRNRRGKEQFVRFGRKGAADITGAIAPWGVRLEIEVKRPGEKRTPEQECFAEDLRRSGAIVILAHSAQEAVTAVHNAKQALLAMHGPMDDLSR
jgi:hypothetical protein